MPTTRMNCSICIATYKRDVLLERTLISIENQFVPNNLYVEIIVVDNDPKKSALRIINKFKEHNKLDLFYYVQPIKNISLTRNKAIAMAKGEVILFIDDDEIASPLWLFKMIETMRKFYADGVFGCVVSDFHDQAPFWVKKCSLFDRTCPHTGTEAHNMRTGNCLIKSSILKTIPGPFDEKYGITGGEDTHLFEKLQKLGMKFVNCKEAWIAEYVPPERTRITSILKQTFKRGNTYTRRVLELSTDAKKQFQIKTFLKSIIYVPGSLLLTMIAVAHKPWCLYWATKTASNVGHFFALLGFFYKGYK